MKASGDDPWLGKTIDGRYVLRRRIGRGGMGVVYEAEHAALDRRVAIKLIAAAEAPEAFLIRFRREAKLASRITHEHLVHIYDVGTDPESGSDYIVMELVEGRDLGKELEGGPISIPRAVSITRQMLEGLAAIHEAGIIHRDIKPANVMLTTRPGEPDYVKLMDFGVARSIGDASLTVTGHIVGTPQFMAPEQLRGQEVDARSDLYAVGITLYAMLTARLPFEGENTAVIAGKHVFAAPPSVATLRPETPPAVVAAVARALEKAPADRYADARAFAAALVTTGAVADTPSNAGKPPTAVTVSARPPKKTKAASRAPLIALIVLLAGAAVAGTWVATHRSGSGEDVVRAEPPPPPPPPPATPDAAVVVEIAPDAGIMDAEESSEPGPTQPITPRPAKTDARPPDKSPKSSGPTQHCHCIPTNAPDVIALCPTRGPSRCRCDTSNGSSLCSTPLVERRCRNDESFDCGPYAFVCPDTKYKEYHVEGTADAACSGYAVPRWGTPDATRVNGHLECDVCPGAKLDAFEGHEGDACNGYYWRTGESKAGTLAHCE